MKQTLAKLHNSTLYNLLLMFSSSFSVLWALIVVISLLCFPSIWDIDVQESLTKVSSSYSLNNICRII